MRLEQIPQLKQLIEKKLDELQEHGNDPQKIVWKVTVLPGEGAMEIRMDVDFKSMKHPSDPEGTISKEQLSEIVTGALTYQGEEIPSVWKSGDKKKPLVE